MTLLSLALPLIAASAPQATPELDLLANRAFRYFFEQSHPTTGLTKDRARNIGAVDSYTTASIAATGYALTAYCIGVERGWMTHSQAQAKVRSTLSFLRTTAAKQNGWFYHFVNWSTGARVGSSEVSSIDTAILLANAIAAVTYLGDSQSENELNQILGAVDWNWMLRNGGALPNSLTFCHGWRPESGFIPFRWDSYSELAILVLLGYAYYPSMPTSSWAAVQRPIVVYQGIQVLSGGPLFMHQLSNNFVDFRAYRDNLGWNYWRATYNQIQANRQYCITNPNSFAGYGPNFWGLSAGDSPFGYVAHGAPGWGVDNGTITPTATIASLPYHPNIANQAAQFFASNYSHAWGRYGISNGINPSQNWVAPDVIGIDLGMMLQAIENHRTGMVHAYFMKTPAIQTGLSRMGFKQTKSESFLPKLWDSP